LQDAYEQAISEGAKALVISGQEGMFSAGLDVPELIAQDREHIEEFWLAFFQLMNLLAKSSVPIGAAITGHAPAGGLVMALHCDYRIATRGAFKLGLNEVQVGLPVPRNILFALEIAIGQRQAAWYASAGELMAPEEALAIGLVDRLADTPAAAVEHCLQRAEQLLALPSIAMNKTRLAAKSALLDVSAEMSSFVRLAVDAWFEDEAQDKMREMAEKLSK
ncbi:MAG: enoyl-CoA hydratase/isomerase family protein, partial [Gammaproteobacteria bacterium]